MPLSVLPAMRLVISAGLVIGSPSDGGSSAIASRDPTTSMTTATTGRHVARNIDSDPDAGTLFADRQIGGVAVLGLEAERSEIGGAVIGNRNELHAAVRPDE